MLDPDGEKLVSNSDIVPYTDPGLQSRRARTALAARLWEAGQLRLVRQCFGYVSPFTVVKKILNSPAKSAKDIS
jgi:hypothetical protein